MNYNLVDLVFAVFSYLYTAYALEHEMGTVRLISRFLTMGHLIYTIFIPVCLSTGHNKQVSGGLWPMVFADMAR